MYSLGLYSKFSLGANSEQRDNKLVDCTENANSLNLIPVINNISGLE